MKTRFQIRGIHSSATLRHRLARPLESLGDLIPVTSAEAVMEYQPDQAPAFRASALLSVPGPDIHAEARDHTLDAVWLKVTAALRRQIERRKAHQATRLKTRQKLRAPPVAPHGSAAAGMRA